MGWVLDHLTDVSHVVMLAATMPGGLFSKLKNISIVGCLSTYLKDL